MTCCGFVTLLHDLRYVRSTTDQSIEFLLRENKKVDAAPLGAIRPLTAVRPACQQFVFVAFPDKVVVWHFDFGDRRQTKGRQLQTFAKPVFHLLRFVAQYDVRQALRQVGPTQQVARHNSISRRWRPTTNLCIFSIPCEDSPHGMLYSLLYDQDIFLENFLKTKSIDTRLQTQTTNRRSGVCALSWDEL